MPSEKSKLYIKFFENILLTWELTCKSYRGFGQDLLDL